MHDAEGEAIERAPAAVLVADDVDLVPARGERVGGLDQHALGAAAALGELFDHEADLPARPVQEMLHCADPSARIS